MSVCPWIVAFITSSHNGCPQSGWTALYTATFYSKKLEVVKALVTAGADVVAAGKVGETIRVGPLEWFR